MAHQQPTVPRRCLGSGSLANSRHVSPSPPHPSLPPSPCSTSQATVYVNQTFHLVEYPSPTYSNGTVGS